jgi:nucleotide-binding universal stress UspA family protein
MSYKTILVHCEADRSTEARLKLALDLADRFGAHVIGLHIRQGFQAPAFTDAGLAMDALYKTYEAAVKADEAAAAATFKKVIGTMGYSNEWRVTDDHADEALIAQGRYADLVVVGQSNPDGPPTATPANLAEKVAMASERPVLVVPHIGVTKPVGKIAMLCWNDSREAARAAAAALPLLKAADKVIVLTIDPANATDGDVPGADVAEWLARHGVKVTVQRDSAASSDVGGVILSRAADHDVDLIVMGIYGHSRMREMVLGGASRTLLASMTAPLLITH